MARFRGGAPSIFVSLASYRDELCRHTITSAFERATFPDRVFIAALAVLKQDEDSWRIVHDGTHVILVNNRIRIRDQIRRRPRTWRRTSHPNPSSQ